MSRTTEKRGGSSPKAIQGAKGAEHHPDLSCQAKGNHEKYSAGLSSGHQKLVISDQRRKGFFGI